MNLTGSSQTTLDVLTGVTAEYLFNVGRTIRFLCDKYSKTMTPEVILSVLILCQHPSHRSA